MNNIESLFNEYEYVVSGVNDAISNGRDCFISMMELSDETISRLKNNGFEIETYTEEVKYSKYNLVDLDGEQPKTRVYHKIRIKNLMK